MPANSADARIERNGGNLRTEKNTSNNSGSSATTEMLNALEARCAASVLVAPWGPP